MDHYIYLLLNLFTLSYPLYKSFDPRVNYHKRWWALFIAIGIVGAGFIVWDHLFTNWGVWGFNPKYILGIYILSLPLEEWLFFITVPFACVFIHEVLRYFIKGDPLQKIAPFITWPLVALLAFLASQHTDKAYTFVNFSVAVVFLLLHVGLFGYRYLGRFYLTYLVHLLPFLLMNGVLTYLPVVWYNNAENLAIRIVSVPIEDTVYSMNLLFMVLTIYEYLLRPKPEVR